MTVTVTGIESLKRKLKSLGSDMEEAVFSGVILTANGIRTDAIKSIQAPSMGTWVKRSRQGGGTYDHVAAKENSAPNTDTGKLVASLAVEPNRGGVYALIGSNLDYAEFLEFGTSKMGARPFLQPALDKNKGDLNKNISVAADLLIQKRTK